MNEINPAHVGLQSLLHVHFQTFTLTAPTIRPSNCHYLQHNYIRHLLHNAREIRVITNYVAFFYKFFLDKVSNGK